MSRCKRGVARVREGVQGIWGYLREAKFVEGVWGCVSGQYEHSRAGGEFVMGMYTRDLELSARLPIDFLEKQLEKVTMVVT